MTIRIHEADGTPYEHIIEIKEASTKFDIPYNTKYKRLKRSRRQKERIAVTATTEFPADGSEDTLLYCLGDVLQSEEEMRDWRLSDWSREDEESMSTESYEWIRMDADFEWICKMTIMMPGYMYLSQLQQDRDVVAQYEVSNVSECSLALLTIPSRSNLWLHKENIRLYLPFSFEP
jgi:transcription initiation factor TFIID subunit 2